MSDRDGEYRIFGPPGTGKTTTLVRQIRNAAEKHGGASVLCASFTKAAAVELAGRVEADGVPVPQDNVGTVHSLCYRGLGSPEVAETHIADFNKGVPSEFQLSKAVSSGVKGRLEDAPADVQDDPDGGVNADAIFGEYNLMRNRMVPDEMMPTRVRAWAAQWERWKADNEYMDFTDMLEVGARQIHYPPNGASILFVDEAQDLTPLQFKLLRGWGKSSRFYILVGDDDQAIYGFTGASASPLLEGGLPDDHIRVLAQSWRVPAKVHELANKWIAKVSARQPKEYRPREHPGSVSLVPATFKDVSLLRATLEEATATGRSIMLLTAARYQVRPIIAMLRRWGIPYHNPYRRAAGDWNPIRSTQVDRIKAFLNPAGPEVGGFKLWSPEQLKEWTSVCAPTGLLVRGGRKLIENFCDRSTWDLDDLLDLYTAVFDADALDAATKCRLTWLVDHIKQERRAGHEYLSHLATLHGIGVLDKRPSVVVGTIHSTKGGEADTVVLFPDLPPSACQAVCSPDLHTRTEARDSIIRQFYVGMTRAKDTLIICNSATPFNVEVVR